MIIKKIKLENYTVFEDQQIEFCPGINIFIGENGTGKTNILKFASGNSRRFRCLMWISTN